MCEHAPEEVEPVGHCSTLKRACPEISGRRVPLPTLPSRVERCPSQEELFMREKLDSGEKKRADSSDSQDWTYKYLCHLCPRMFYAYRAVVLHLIMFHVEAKLPAWPPGFGDHRCVQCNKVLHDAYEHYEHHAFVHRGLQRSIPPKNFLELKLDPGSVRPGRDRQEAEDLAALIPGLNCFECGSKFVILHKLFEHYTLFHFRNLKEKYGDRCASYCPGFGITGYAAVVHLAYVHDAIGELVNRDQSTRLRLMHASPPPSTFEDGDASLQILKPEDNALTGDAEFELLPPVVDSTIVDTIEPETKVCSIEDVNVSSPIVFAKKSLPESYQCLFCHNDFPCDVIEQHQLDCEKTYASCGKKKTSPFTCHLCRVFKRTAALLVTHLGWVHFRDAVMANFDISPNTSNCPDCGSSFKDFHKLIVHLSKFHSGIKNYLPVDVYNHLKIHNGFKERRKSSMSCEIRANPESASTSVRAPIYRNTVGITSHPRPPMSAASSMMTTTFQNAVRITSQLRPPTSASSVMAPTSPNTVGITSQPRPATSASFLMAPTSRTTVGMRCQLRPPSSASFVIAPTSRTTVGMRCQLRPPTSASFVMALTSQKTVEMTSQQRPLSQQPSIQVRCLKVEFPKPRSLLRDIRREPRRTTRPLLVDVGMQCWRCGRKFMSAEAVIQHAQVCRDNQREQ